MAYLDHYLKARNERLQSPVKSKPKAIIKGARRTNVINKILDEMADYRDSPFEHEGVYRAALRSALCLGGNAWTVSDVEAANLVAECLLLMGARRPTWDEGQPEYLLSYDICHNCNGSMPASEYEGGRKGMFCSSGCASVWMTRRQSMFAGSSYLTKGGHSHVGSRSKAQTAALRILKRESTPRRRCAQCNEMYRPYGQRTANQKYCSHGCYSIAKKTIPVRACPQCGESFQGFSADQIHCSRACAQLTSSQKTCRGCALIFNAKSKKAVFCSDACRVWVRKNPNAKSFRGAVLTHTCLHCAEEFQATNIKKQYCGDRCSGAAERMRLKMRRQQSDNVVYLTAEIFDSWFKVAA